MIRINIRFVILTILAYIFAYVQGGNLPYTIFYALFISLIFSIFTIFILSISIGIDIRMEERVYTCGDIAPISILANNRSIIPSPYVVIKNNIISLFNPKFIGELISLRFDETKNLKYNINFKNRGIYDIGSMSVSIRDLFCVFTVNKSIKKNTLVKVYPKIYELEKSILKSADIFKNATSTRSSIEDMYSVKDMRKYRDGDNLKRINWKVSAKLNELFVRNFETVSGQELNIFLDMNKSNYNMDREGILEEKMVDFCASLVNFAVLKDIKSKLYINCNGFIEYDVENKEDMQNLQELFLTQKSDGDFSFLRFINSHRNKLSSLSGVAIITGKISDALTNSLMNMQDVGYKIIVFYTNKTAEDMKNSEFLNKIGVECINICELIRCIEERESTAEA